MLVTIHQPDFLPWLGFFNRWARADLLILLDDVQFLRQGWHHRDKIKAANGPVWLTVPVKKKGRFSQEIQDTEIDNSSRWAAGHLQTIRHCYAKARNFQRIFPSLEKIYLKQRRLLADLNVDFLAFFAAELKIVTPYRRSSGLAVPGSSSEKLINLLQACGATAYLSGLGARDYLDENLFREAQIALEYQHFDHPIYPQLHGAFMPQLSSLDFLMNADEQALDSLLQGFRPAHNNG